MNTDPHHLHPVFTLEHVKKPWTCVEWAKIYILTSMMVWSQADMHGVILMVTGPYTGDGAGDCLYKFLTYFEKEQSDKKICGDDKTRT